MRAAIVVGGVRWGQRRNRWDSTKVRSNTMRFLLFSETDAVFGEITPTCKE
jgi:hypothetical protein